jgi:predicted DNA-binding protein
VEQIHAAVSHCLADSQPVAISKYFLSMSQKDDSRTISFRLPLEQFEKLQEVCSEKGASQSVMFRVMIDQLIHGSEKTNLSSKHLELRVKRLESRLASLALEVKRMKTN